MIGLLAQTDWFGPALTVAAGLIVMVVVETAGGQSPRSLTAVKLTVALPARISAALGV